MLAWFLPGTAAARPVAVAATCHARAALGESYAEVAAAPSRWRCDPTGQNVAPEVTFVLFRLPRDGATPLPRSFVAHYGRFAQVTLTALDADGAARSRTYPMDAVERVHVGPFFRARLPAIGPQTEAVVARIERPWIDHTLTQNWLDDDPAGSGWPIGEVAVLAMVCGILLVPLLLNAAFYWAMPRRYVLWHLVMVSATLIQTAILTGMLAEAVPVPLSVEVAISDLSFAVLGAGSLMFALAFVEPGMIGRRLGQAMRVQAALGIAVVAAVTLLLPQLRPVGIMLVHLALLPGILLLVLAMIAARRRGSRAIVFQIVGWSPALAVSAWRIASFALTDAPSEAPLAYHAALAFEVLVTAVAIISRFAILRRERDLAQTRVETLKGEAGRDPLTGLENRLALERNFAGWFRDGFRTMAVVDLDHFKAVNDTHGHATGDAVLRAVAKALSPDGDTRVVRMGGEEFLLLLRGDDSAERAERRRQAIPARVAAEVAGLERMLTASMGLVEQASAGRQRPDFLAFYRHCDRLLYEAKRGGRNRTMQERVMAFERRRRPRTAAA